MKVRINYGNVQLEGEGTTHKEVFKELAAMTEVFRDETCALCKKNNCILVVRNVADPKNPKKTYEYYERRCLNPGCGGRLAYGQHNEGGSLFPKRLDEDKKALPNRGWHKWEGKKEKASK
jgi:hypothetical protein